jgi:hypothetical protein
MLMISRFRKYRFNRACAWLGLSLLLLPGCAAAGSSQAASSPAVPASPAAAVSPALQLLAEARQAATGLNRYALNMQLTQDLNGGDETSGSNVRMSNVGRVERQPLKLDQTIQSDMDGDVSSLRTILVPNAYYMYDPELSEWSRLTPEETKNISATLSEFQVDLHQAFLSVEKLGAGLTIDRSGKTDLLRYTGNGAEATAFLNRVLASTLGLSGMDEQVRKSISVQSLKLTMSFDKATHWPASFRIESIMTIEFEPGKPSTVTQTFSGTYSKYNETAGIEVPKEALEAPVAEEQSP